MKPRSRPGQRVQLHRAFSKLGIGSRGMAWKLIVEGLVRVNGRVVRDPLTWVDIAVDKITCENASSIGDSPESLGAIGNKTIGPGFPKVTPSANPLEKPATRVWMVHKPTGLVTTRSDERGRPTVYSLFPDADSWKFPVGRLDADSEGLLLFTNDGPLADALTDPDRGVEKRYLVTVAGTPEPAQLALLGKGVEIEGKRTRPSQWRLVSSEGRRSIIEVVLHEGKNRQIRKMAESIGHKVQRLVRVGLGFLELGDLAPGAIRELAPEEWKRLIP